MVVGKVTLTNRVPPVVLPMGTPERPTHRPRKDWILEELNLQSLEEWPKEEQEQAKKLLVKQEHLFAHSDFDLGKMSLIKHQMELIDWMPFKEHYQQIPLYMYNEVKAHLQEMLASAVVLVQKKDGSLRFCTDLRKLNSQTVTDTYSLPRSTRPLTACRGPRGSPSLT